MTEREQMQEQKMPVVAVVLAAGFGTRFDENNPKQLVSVGDKPIVCWSIEAFERNDRVSDIIVVVNERVSNMVNMLIDEAGYTKVRAVIPGGSERVDSTRSALDLLKQAGIPMARKSSSTIPCDRSSNSNPSTAASTASTSSTRRPWHTRPLTRFY